MKIRKQLENCHINLTPAGFINSIVMMCL